MILELDKIVKSFNNTKVLKGISIAVEEGEFITFLGSSGCGKTTTLRIIAGLESPDSGRVLLKGEDITNIEPNKRDVNTVFQNYALFPHMNVFDNIAYSLKLKKVNKAEIKKRVLDTLELVKLEGYQKRMPSELSGGQRQRVAIARAIINNPSVLLLDEPLGALDLQLRRQMQTELKKLQKKLGITFIYITHDQEEAMNMSDRIVVMNDGQFEQIGTPSEIYDYPKTSFVAKFIGTSNILEGTIIHINNNEATVEFNDSNVVINTADYKFSSDEKIIFSIRSENILLSKEAKDNFTLKATVLEHNYSGGVLRIVLELANGQEIISSKHGINSDIKVGETVFVYWKPESAVIVDKEDRNEKE